MDRRIEVVAAPSNLGLMPPSAGAQPGVALAPTVLKMHQLVKRLGATEVRTEPPPYYSPDVDPESGVRNADGIRRYSGQLAAALEPVIGTGAFALVLGGDCSILLGAMLALRQMGPHGLVFVDGHRDFLTPETSPTAGAAGMDLALLTGHGPPKLTDLGTGQALVPENLVHAIGFRDGSGDEYQTDINWTDLHWARRRGLPQTALLALDDLRSSSVSGFWIHLDVDVLNYDVMPAVDSPQSDGFDFTELTSLLEPLVRDKLARGMTVTIFDPDRDASGEAGRDLTDFLVRLLT